VFQPVFQRQGRCNERFSPPVRLTDTGNYLTGHVMAENTSDAGTCSLTLRVLPVAFPGAGALGIVGILLCS